jgi:hypothetical protein
MSACSKYTIINNKTKLALRNVNLGTVVNTLCCPVAELPFYGIATSPGTTFIEDFVMPYEGDFTTRFSFIDFIIYGAGGDGATLDGTVQFGGAGSGAYLAASIPYELDNSSGHIKSMVFNVADHGTGSPTFVLIRYTNRSTIQLSSGGGLTTTTTAGGTGGVTQITNASNISFKYNAVDGEVGGALNTSGTNNGYTVSGSGAINVTNAGNPVTNTNTPVAATYEVQMSASATITVTIKSSGGGEDQPGHGNVSNTSNTSEKLYGYIGGGGAPVSSNYTGADNYSASSIQYGSKGAILWTVSNSAAFPVNISA